MHIVVVQKRPRFLEWQSCSFTDDLRITFPGMHYAGGTDQIQSCAAANRKGSGENEEGLINKPLSCGRERLKGSANFYGIHCTYSGTLVKPLGSMPVLATIVTVSRIKLCFFFHFPPIGKMRPKAQSITWHAIRGGERNLIPHHVITFTSRSDPQDRAEATQTTKT